jgi:hypothetical protein
VCFYVDGIHARDVGIACVGYPVLEG